ncbi:MAG: hypothetical protein KDA88_00995 [Planctomycetaceae bacterium]|nr:hypothetical protein [Planctomycetaceae bacterium]MCB9952450.1 hypothetical protein [Planctomycetaceae bacterium]
MNSMLNYSALLLLLLGNAPAVLAQDYRVYTTVASIDKEAGKEDIVSHSLTLFHAGKVYDYMEDVGEVVILEPERHRFIILGGNYTATEVPFAEVHRFLDVAQDKAQEYLAEVQKSGDAEQIRRSQALAFQMSPKLKVSFTEADKILSLQGDLLSYRVDTANSPSAEFLGQYLEYANWAARLNYVLHPHAAYPTARLQLDDELRQRGLIPVVVELSANLDSPVQLKARHDYRVIQSIDRQLIHRWEQQLDSEETKWLTFHEYQQKLLTSQSK